MFAAVYGFPSEETARNRLERIARSAGNCAAARYLIDGGTGLLVCPNQFTCLDETKRTVWHGEAPHTPSVGSGVAWERARGAFSAAALQSGSLLLARGRFGGRPLYYAREGLNGRTIVACSRLEPLIQTMGFAPSLDDQRMLEFVATGSIVGECTIYQGVYRLLSAQILVFARDSFVIRRLAPIQVKPLSPHEDPREVARELRAQIQRAVQRSLSGVRRVAVAAGGGVDSSSLLATVIAQSRGANPREVKAIALDFAGPGSDQPHLRKLTEALGIAPLRVLPSDCVKNLGDSLVIDAAPVVSPAMALCIELARKARDNGAEVLLAGGGADDLFDGDLAVFPDQARRGDFIGALIGAARLRGIYWIPSRRARIAHLLLRPLARETLPPSVEALWRRAQAWRHRRPEEWFGRKLKQFVYDQNSKAKLRKRGVGNIVDVGAAEHLLNLRDAREQVEIRSGCPHIEPFLSDDLLEFVARIPPAFFFFGNIRRGLLRESMRGILPDSVRLREDKASAGPAIAEMLSTEGAIERIRPWLPMSAIAERAFIDAAAVSKFVSDTSRSNWGAWLNLWPALALEALHGMPIFENSEERAA